MSFFKTDLENVLVSTIKKAEDSDEAVIRIIDMEGKDQSVTFESFKNIVHAKLTNLIETELQPLQITDKQVKLQLGHHAIETIKIK